MNNWLAATGATLALLATLLGGTVQLNELYAKQLKLRILEIDLKPQQTPADRALREYLKQELQKLQ